MSGFPSPKTKASLKDMVAIAWSKAKTADLRYLSNFQEAPFRVAMPDGVVMYFPSVEAAFHAHKAFYLMGGGSAPGFAASFTVGGALGALDGAKCKSAGGRKAFAKRGLVLDRAQWEGVKVGVMQRLVLARAAADVRYGTICCNLVREGYTIKHHVPRGKDDLLLGQRLQELGKSLVDVCAPAL